MITRQQTIRRILKLALVGSAALLVSGCIEISTSILVRRDGSGTIEQTVLLTTTFIELMESFGQGDALGEGEFVDEDELRDQALALGEGVSLTSFEPVSADQGRGYTAVYEFNDVENLRINQNPSELLPSTPAGESGEDPEEFYSFAFKDGTPAILTILSPSLSELQETAEDGQEDSRDTDENAELDEEMLELFRTLYEGMRIGIAVEVEGTIVETNASYVDGSRVTILELDFGEVLRNEGMFEELAAASPESLEETKQMLQDVPGIRIEVEREVVIRFR